MTWVTVAPGACREPATASTWIKAAPARRAKREGIDTCDGTLTYQWQRNGASIAGATSASYTTPATGHRRG